MDAVLSLPVLIVLIAVALAFDFLDRHLKQTK